MQLSDEAKKMIEGNHRVLGKLSYTFNKHYKTIENWVKNNHIILTTPTATDIIIEETGLTVNQIFVSEKAVA